MCNKVLIVEDDETILEVYSKILKKIGYEVYESKNIYDALELWQEHKIGIVLSDLSMDDNLDGLSLCSRIRGKDLRTILIAVTGNASENLLEICLNVGFRDLLIKPISTELLISTVKWASDQHDRWKDF